MQGQGNKKALRSLKQYTSKVVTACAGEASAGISFWLLVASKSHTSETPSEKDFVQGRAAQSKTQPNAPLPQIQRTCLGGDLRYSTSYGLHPYKGLHRIDGKADLRGDSSSILPLSCYTKTGNLRQKYHLVKREDVTPS